MFLRSSLRVPARGLVPTAEELLLQMEELRTAVGNLVDLVTGRVTIAKRRALLAKQKSQELMKDKANAALDLTEEGLAKTDKLAQKVSDANTEGIKRHDVAPSGLKLYGRPAAVAVEQLRSGDSSAHQNSSAGP